MKLIDIALENVCQHVKLSHAFHPGLNGVVGRNGAGKTNLIKAIAASLTGDFDNAGNKAENVSQLAGAGDVSRIVARFRHGDAELEIVRALGGAKSQIKVDGGKPSVGDKRVNEVVAEILGVDAPFLADYVFVPQRRIFDFLIDRPADRSRNFQRLFGLAKADDLFVLLGKELNQTPIVQLAGDPEELARTVADWEAKEAALRSKLDQIPEVTQEELDNANRYQKQAWARLHDIQTCRASRRAAIAARAQAAEAGAAARAAEELLSRAEATQANLDAAETVAKDLSAAWKDYHRWSNIAANVRQRQEDLNRTAARRQPVPPLDEETHLLAGRFDAEGNELLARHSKLKHFVESIRGDMAACPTCGTPVSNLKDELEAARRELPILSAGIESMKEATLRRQKHQRAAETLARVDAEIASKQKQIADDQAALPLAQRPERAESELANWISQARAGRAELAAIRQRAQLARGWCSRVEGEYAAASGQWSAAKGKLRAHPRPDRNILALTRQFLAAQDELSSARGSLEGELRVVAEALSRDRARLEAARKAEAAAGATNGWRSALEEMRKIVGPAALPRLVMQNRLAEIEEEATKLLSAFGVDFTIRAADDLSFIAEFRDGRSQRVDRLSAGEKVIVALAIRTVIVGLSDIGMLCLDEPTDSLDVDNIATVETALNRLRNLSQSRDLQCLVVTHDRKLARLFDATLDLGRRD